MKKTKKTSKVRKVIRITALSLAGVILAAVISAAVVLYGRAATVMSVRKAGNQLYTVNFRQNYHLDKALAADIKTEDELLQFICDEFYFGYQVANNVREFACSAFLTDTPDGKKLVGRNFDFDETETLSVYTHPGDGYASFSSVDLDVMAVGNPNATDPLSLEGKIAMLAAPYLCVDGMNEKGLSVSLLDLDYDEVHEFNDRPSLLIMIAVRMLLDRAADVDEALEMLGQYDIHTVHGVSQHMFLADKSGRAVVVEWHKNRMKVSESNVCTNFRLSKKTESGGWEGQCDRFDTITDRLAKHPQNSAEEAADILKAASVSWTQWSCVYALDDFTVDYAIDMDYGTVYHLDPRAF